MNQLSKRALNYPSAERNKSFILKVLQEYIVSSDAVSMLEVSSGTGQHAGYFATNLPNVTIQPTEVDESLFGSITAYAEQVRSVKPGLLQVFKRRVQVYRVIHGRWRIRLCR